MKAFVGVTDWNWFSQLRREEPDDVNFWRPSGQLLRALQPGDPFLFKLHAPRNAIAGGGFFVESPQLPVSQAWMAFERRNARGRSRMRCISAVRVLATALAPRCRHAGSAVGVLGDSRVVLRRRLAHRHRVRAPRTSTPEPMHGDVVRTDQRIGRDDRYTEVSRLGDEHTIEGIAVVRRKPSRLEHVRVLDRDRRDTGRTKAIRHEALGWLR